MNNVILNWKRLSKFKGKKRLEVEDKPYLKEQIRRLLEFADLRVKCIIYYERDTVISQTIISKYCYVLNYYFKRHGK